jgi:hypothetical protein
VRWGCWGGFVQIRELFTEFDEAFGVSAKDMVLSAKGVIERSV